MKKFTVVFTPDPKGGYTVTVPAMPGIVTHGKTLEEGIAMAREAIACWVDDARTHGEPIPEEDLRPELMTIERDAAWD